MAVIPTRNFTRYNTDDLTAIQERVETYIVAHGQTPAPLSNVGNIEFHDYAPADPSETLKRWNGKGYDTEKTRKYVGKIIHARPERVGLLSPGSLYDNPVEALTSMQEVELAPERMIATLAAELLRRYNFASWHYRGPTIDMNLAGLRLRIEPKVANKKPPSLREREQARKALNALDIGQYDLRAALHQFTRYRNHVQKANKHYPTPDGLVLQRHAESTLQSLQQMQTYHEDHVKQSLKDKRAELAEEV